MENNSVINIQRDLRLKLLDMYYAVKAGHIGCSLSCIDLMIAVLIQHKKEKDTFILSKGHAAASLYACLNYLGEISDEEIKTFYRNGTKLPAHPSANKFKGIPFALGSLGHGLPIATGIAKANKILENDSLSYVLMSDGETNEGTTWEAAHFAVSHGLDNLVVIIDKNNLQGFGTLKDTLGDTADEQKWHSIGFEVTVIDGHNMREIYESIERLKYSKNSKPKVLIAETVKGKGVKYMENKLDWHYLPMSEELYNKAMDDIKQEYHA